MVAIMCRWPFRVKPRPIYGPDGTCHDSNKEGFLRRMRANEIIRKGLLTWLLTMIFWAGLACAAQFSSHINAHTTKPQPWPGGIIPYDISKLTPEQQAIVKRGMQRWMDTGAQISFVLRTNQEEYVFFTGNLTNGNNTSLVGYKKGARAEINITAFWWRQEEWMIVHELGHVLGFHHEHQRWDRDDYITVHFENIKAGRASDYDRIERTNWIVSS